MSGTVNKLELSSSSHVKPNSQNSSKTFACVELERAPEPRAVDFNHCHMKSPMVHLMQLNIPNGNIHKTDSEREQKTESFADKVACTGGTDESGDDPNRNIEENAIAKVKTVNERTASIPDSTTRQFDANNKFNCGDEVFVLHKDGRYYLGTVISSEVGGERWLVKFGDNTERWAGLSELRLLSSPGGADAPAMCVVCKLSGGNRNDEVISCDKCGRGYHPGCHSPPGNSRIKGAPWHCRRCVDQRFKVAAAEHRAQKKAEMVKIKQKIRTLPYDITSLHWDSQHRTNTENIYCYCGTLGDWFTQMLQCARCKQWFHQNCILCLKYPLYSGDRFYMFVCSLCNYGMEFLRRLEMKWVDLVHLVLFNLTMYHSKKYFDLDTVIIPYIGDNWHALQLPQKMNAATASERRDFILSSLSNNGNRFKCGREIKKRTTIWGLRSRTPPTPPSAPTAPLPRGIISDNALSGRWGRLAFVPYPQEYKSAHNGEHQQMIVPADSHWQTLMMGSRFQTCSGSDNESPRSTPSPMPLSDYPSGYHINDSKKNNVFSEINNRDDNAESDYVSSEDMPLSDRINVNSIQPKKLKFYEVNFQGGGLVKKSVPFPKLNSPKHRKSDGVPKQKNRKWNKQPNLESEESVHRNRRKLRKSLAKQQKLKTLKTLLSNNTSINSSHETMSYGLQHNIAKGPNIPFGNAMKANEVVLPPTPPTSMSAPPTPPTVIIPSSSSNSSDMLSEYQTQQSYQKEILNYDSDQDSTDFKDHKSNYTNCNSKLLNKSIEKTPKKLEKDISESSETVTDKIETAKHNLRSTAINLEIPKLSTKNIIEHSKIMSLHHIKSEDIYSIFSKNKVENDSSGDDTSSRGTLDSIIPHPANFQGANNPFHNVSSKADAGKSSSRHNSSSTKGNTLITNKLFNRHSLNKKNGTTKQNKCPRISLPVNLNPVIPSVKLMKRQLSEKDLIIGPNGEVKRKRHRRNKASNSVQTQPSSNVPLNERQKSLRSSLGQDDPNKGYPSVIDGPHQLAITMNDHPLNMRCLRQRQEKNYCDRRRGSTSSNNANSPHTISTSNISNAQSIATIGSSGVRSLYLASQNCMNDQWHSSDDMQDLKSSVHSYFGAANRISSGEKFTLAGKRITETGKLQYLIEWEGHGS